MAKKVKDYEYTKMVAIRFALLAFMLRFPRLLLFGQRIVSPFTHKQTWYNDFFRYV